MYTGVFLGEAKGTFFPPENGFASSELCLNDKIDFNMIKILPPLFLKDSICPPEFIF